MTVAITDWNLDLIVNLDSVADIVARGNVAASNQSLSGGSTLLFLFLNLHSFVLWGPTE